MPRRPEDSPAESPPEVSAEKPAEMQPARALVVPGQATAAGPPPPQVTLEQFDALMAKKPPPDVYVVAPGHTVNGRAGAKHSGELIEPRELSGGIPHMLELVASGAVIKQ